MLYEYFHWLNTTILVIRFTEHIRNMKKCDYTLLSMIVHCELHHHVTIQVIMMQYTIYGGVTWRYCLFWACYITISSLGLYIEYKLQMCFWDHTNGESSAGSSARLVESLPIYLAARKKNNLVLKLNFQMGM